MQIVSLLNILFLFQISDEEEVDPFAMPLWRKLVWSLFFFMMVATADIGNIIGRLTNMIFD